MKGRAWHRQRGLLEMLPPRGKRRFSLEIGVVEGAALGTMLATLGHAPPLSQDSHHVAGSSDRDVSTRPKL
jgi:hypothetical protein